MADNNHNDGNGKKGFQPGHPDYSGGRKLGSKNVYNKDSRKALLQALNIVSKDKAISHGKTFWEWVATRAYKSDAVLIALLKKFIPDLQSVEFDLTGKGAIKRVKFELIESRQKPDLVPFSTNKTLKELEE